MPDEVSTLLGAIPSTACTKGERLVGRSSGQVRLAKHGAWLLNAADREHEDIESQIFEILEQLTLDLNKWNCLASKFQVDMFCGAFMSSGNDGLELSAKVLSALGERGITLGFDIYDSLDD